MVTDTHRSTSPEDAVVNLIPQMPISSLPCGAPVYYMQFLDEKSGSSTSMAPWWSMYGGVSYPMVQPCNPVIPTKESNLDMQNEGSLTGSNTSDTESGGGKEEVKRPFLVIGSERSAFTRQHKEKKDKCIKGFVPYKRCLAQRDTQSSGEEREEQRVRLCL